MRILIITHSDAYPDNAVVHDLKAMGHDLFWRRPELGETLPAVSDQDFDAAVSFGGPQFVTEIDQLPWMQREAAWIKDFVEAGNYFLGVCLGAQLLAHAFGGRIWRYPDETSEVGVYDVMPLPEGHNQAFLAEPAKFYQWHLEGFDYPEDAIPLATSDLFPNQAFRLGDRAYGIQFHPEITGDLIARWTKSVTENKPEVFLRPKVRPAAVHLTEWQSQADRISAWRQNFLSKWLAG